MTELMHVTVLVLALAAIVALAYTVRKLERTLTAYRLFTYKVANGEGSFVMEGGKVKYKEGR